MSISQNILMMLEGENPKEKKQGIFSRAKSTIDDAADSAGVSRKKAYVHAGLVGTGVAGIVGGPTYLAYRGAKDILTKRPTTIGEKTQDLGRSVKDVIKNKIMEHPKTAAAIAATGALGTGYGAYRYIKGRKKSKE